MSDSLKPTQITIDQQSHGLPTRQDVFAAPPAPIAPSAPSAAQAAPLLYAIKLTPEQQQAAAWGLGTRAIVATAGSGKTTTMSARIARMILEHNVVESSILATSFTKASATDLKARIDKMTGRKTGVISGTLHSFCANLLLGNHQLAGYQRRPVVIEESESKSLIDQVVYQATGVSDKSNLTEFSITEVRKWIFEADVRRFSQDRRDFDPSFGLDGPHKKVAEIASLYKDKLRTYGYLDFDSILVEALAMLRDSGEALSHLLPAHVFIDEAQDLSAIQWFVIAELAKLAKSVDVIGDDDQSIYGWRRALPWRFRDFAAKADERHILAANRRCAGDIVALAASIIGAIPSERRIDKDLSAARSEAGSVRYTVLPTLDSLSLVATRIKQEIAESKAPPPAIATAQDHIRVPRKYFRDFAVIARSTTYVFPKLERAFSAAQIPYRILGGDSTFDAPESRLLRNLGKLISSAGSGPSSVSSDQSDTPTTTAGPELNSGFAGGVIEPLLLWSAVMQSGGVSASGAASVIERVEALGGTFSHVVSCLASSRVADGSKFEFGHMQSVVARYREKLRQKLKVTMGNLMDDSDLSAITERAVKRFVAKGIDARRKKDGKISNEMAKILIEDETESRLENLKEVFRAYADTPLEEALISIEMGLNKEQEEDQDLVTISTAHSSKGLEWDTVFVAEVNAASWPSAMAFRGTKDASASVLTDIEDEERRLLYVAVTRAKNQLFMLSSLFKQSFGESRGMNDEQAQEPSQFLPLLLVEALKPLFVEVFEKRSSKGRLLSRDLFRSGRETLSGDQKSL